VVGERAGQEHPAAVQDEPAWFAPGGAQVLLGMMARLHKVGAAFDVPGDEIAARFYHAQRYLQLGRVEHIGSQPPGMGELGVEPGELPGADPFGEQPG